MSLYKSDPSIYIITNSLNIGGAEKQSIMLANCLKEHYPTYLVVYYGDQVDPRYNKMVDEYHIHTIWLAGSHLRKMFYLYNLFRKNRSSFIFSYLATANIINAIIGGLAGVKYRYGGIRSSQIYGWKLNLQKFLHNHLLTGSIFNNYEGQKYLCKLGFKEKKSIVIHNCIQVSSSVERRDTNLNSEIVILSVGRFTPEKDYNTALKAFRLMIDSMLDKNNTNVVKYKLIGYGSLLEDIEKIVEELHLKNEVEILINPKNISNYFTQADIYLSTSIQEGLSNSIMEAMSFGLPVIATNVGDNRYLVVEGETGYLVPIRDADAISDKLIYLINNPDRLKEFGIKGYQHIRNNFSTEIFSQRYISLINSLTNGKA